MSIESLLWPADQLDHALDQLARRSGLVKSRLLNLPRPSAEQRPLTLEQTGHWLDLVASHLGIEIEASQCSYADIERFLAQGGPLLLRLPTPAPATNLRVLAVQRRTRHWIEVLAPNLSVHRLPMQQVRAALCAVLETPHQAAVERLVAAAKIPSTRHTQVQRVLLREQIGEQWLSCGWLLRLPPNGGWAQQGQRLQLLAPFTWMFGGMIVQQGLLMLAWWLIGSSVLQGTFQRGGPWGWLWGWALIMFSALLFQFIANQAQQQLSIRTATYFKQRLLYGILRLDTQEIRHQGLGQFLHRMMEAEAVETFGLNGGFGLLFAGIQLVAALLVLSLGVGGWRLPVLLLFWLVLMTLGSWLYLRRMTEYEMTYQALTNDQVERMMGHRTRLAQEDPAHWHTAEDQALAAYWQSAQRMDQLALLLRTFAMRGWQVIGFVVLFAMLLCGQERCVTLGQDLPVLQPLLLLLAGGTPASSFSLAVALLISLRGLLLAQQAFSGLLAGLESLSGLLIAWRQVRPLFDAAQRSEPAPAVLLAADNHLLASDQADSQLDRLPFLLAQQLDFRYRNEGKWSVQGATLSIYPRDRLLLEGASGGGKSSLVALLAGLRQPNSGLLLLHGFDRRTLGGQQWRRRVVAVPQFHENHIFNESLAFNLLLGRCWPPQPEELQAAEEICQELGLGELLAQMPAGMQQMLGESGWRLSHGERSRIYLGRALLQPADLILCDESFAALDPQTMQVALSCVLRRAPALLVIAHP